MKLLSIETSTMMGGIAILDDDILIAESRLNVKSTHSERIMTEIDHLLMQSALKIDAFDVFAVAIGPGSFTGLRVGLSTAKGLVYATGKKLVSIPTLEALAWNAHLAKFQVCPLIGAQRKEVYAGLFKWTDKGFIRVMDERPIKISALLSGIDETTIFLGEGATLYREDIEKRLGAMATFAPPRDMIPSPANVAFLGMMKAKRGEFDDPATLLPLYFKRSRAEEMSCDKPVVPFFSVSSKQ
ncbi:tRNA (adenosine(37)-N6)-threonylcarbamoyltransferase complex dimerization subunit type 1 TsaB [Thermodesulfovibrionales bacterium]|nr:tRNA (adenosine(37)-N6)-threonylcarbamoyltransferase complex dimerization subunit type 1 TsaB [Thermodesulfovibrionales bacterium]MCL0085920.1 tRNA (adenosine(37)-N6)-threonylcarbamoyltransferase complex dimerization subunit type 1 TsaB [Thermodesulfovibrionales bacterium]